MKSADDVFLLPRIILKMQKYRKWGPPGPRNIILIVAAAVASLQFHLWRVIYHSFVYPRPWNNKELSYIERTGNYTSSRYTSYRKDWDSQGGSQKISVELEPNVIPEIAYRLAEDHPDLDSLNALISDREIAHRARTLQYDLRSLGFSTSADMLYYMRIFQFASEYNFSHSRLYDYLTKTEPSWSWRYFCYRYIDRARVWELPPISTASDKEAVLVETRVFPHVEFVIRAFLKNMGPGWMLTIICSDENEDLMKSIAAGISANIRLLKLKQRITAVNDYNDLFLTPHFWRTLRGEKILVFQEDSILFQTGVDEFIPYDFTGSVWPSNVIDVPSGVGNGGLSLRSRSIMIRVLEQYDVSTFIPSDNLRYYMALQGLKRVPEDVYFAHAIETLGIGRQAPRDVAMKLIESLLPEDTNDIIGGHQWWSAMPGTKWLEYAHEKLITQLILPDNMILATNIISHRGGWKHVLKALINHDFFVMQGDREYTTFIKTPNYVYVDILELTIVKDEKWMILKPRIDNGKKLVAFSHGTITPREPGDILHIGYFWKTQEFKHMRPRISLLMTFSEYVAEHIRELMETTHDMESQVSVIRHPMPEGISEMFDPNRVLCPSCEKRLVALGQQHRWTSTIYLVNTTWDRFWLPSSSLPKEHAFGVASAELRELGIEAATDLKSRVKIVTKSSYLEYERFASSSVLLIHLRDANANNAVLEAIAMATPVIINRHPAAVEYLGADYPLFFDRIADISQILADIPRIEEAAQYLRRMDKTRFHMTTFLRRFDAHLSHLK